MMDGRNATVKVILLDMLDEVSDKYKISHETLDRYASLVETAVKAEDARHACGACKCGNSEG